MNPKKNAPREASKVLSISDLPYICPSVEAWHNGFGLGEAYIDGSAQVYVYHPIMHGEAEPKGNLSLKLSYLDGQSCKGKVFGNSGWTQC